MQVLREARLAVDLAPRRCRDRDAARPLVAVTGAAGSSATRSAPGVGAARTVRGWSAHRVRQRRVGDLARASAAEPRARSTVHRPSCILPDARTCRRHGGALSTPSLAKRTSLRRARLARAARRPACARFVFASTIKVYGEATPPGQTVSARDAPAPHDAYARSKLAPGTGADACRARNTHGRCRAATSLVYGPGVKGNLRALVDAVRERRWLPLGAIGNRRSLLGVDNLLNALDAAIGAPSAPRGVHFVADAASVSTPDLVRAIARALGVAPRIATCRCRCCASRDCCPDVATRSRDCRLAGSRYVVVRRRDRWTPRPFVDRRRRRWHDDHRTFAHRAPSLEGVRRCDGL